MFLGNLETLNITLERVNGRWNVPCEFDGRFSEQPDPCLVIE